jgi:hypothetical protein
MMTDELRRAYSHNADSAERAAAAAQRRANPDQVFGDERFEYPRGGSSAERAAAAAHFQARADAALRLAGLRAPGILAEELMRDYRRRLLHLVQGHCDVDPGLRKVEASRIPRDALPNFENLIIDGAVERFKRPEGPERSCTRRDTAGREITEFYGDPEILWLPFTHAMTAYGQVPGWKLIKIDATKGQGVNSFEARAHRGRELDRTRRAEEALRREEAAAGAGV